MQETWFFVGTGNLELIPFLSNPLASVSITAYANTSSILSSCEAKTKMAPKQLKTRYFKGKAPTAVSESESDSDAEEEEDVKPTYKQRQKQRLEEERNLVAGGAGRVITDVKEIVREGAKAKMGGGMKMDLGNVQVGRKVGDGGVKGVCLVFLRDLTVAPA